MGTKKSLTYHFFMLSILILFIILIPLYSATAADNKKQNSKHHIEVQTNKNNRIYENLIDTIDAYSLNNYQDDIKSEKNKIDEESYKATTDLFNYNMKSATNTKATISPLYLNNFLLNKGNIEFLERLMPDDYSFFDLPKRDNAPINRFNMGINNPNSQNENSSIATAISNALLDVVFGTLTRNTLSFNINKIDNNDSFNVSINPIKGVALKFGTADLGGSAGKNNTSMFELKFIPTKNTNIKLKTTDNSTETKTGIEFEMKF